MNTAAKPAVWSLVLVILAAAFAVAGQFHSVIITASTLSLTVADDHFLRIWNFTQEGGAQRGVVSVTTDSGTANVLAATAVDSTSAPGSSTLEPVNHVVIAGPAQVTIAPVSGATLFVTYRKEPDEERASPAPTATVTPTITPIPTVTPTPTLTPTPTPTP